MRARQARIFFIYFLGMIGEAPLFAIFPEILRLYATRIKSKMGKDSIVQSVMALVEPVIRDENLDLVDVDYKKEGKSWYLRIYIDKTGGVSVEDCQKVSRQIEDMIQIDEIVNSAYILEVSSPGLDRPIKKENDFRRSLGKKVKVTTYSPIDQQRNFVGVIKDFSNQTLSLEVNGILVAIPLAVIANTKLVIEF